MICQDDSRCGAWAGRMLGMKNWSTMCNLSKTDLRTGKSGSRNLHLRKQQVGTAMQFNVTTDDVCPSRSDILFDRLKSTSRRGSATGHALMRMAVLGKNCEKLTDLAKLADPGEDQFLIDQHSTLHLAGRMDRSSSSHVHARPHTLVFLHRGEPSDGRDVHGPDHSAVHAEVLEQRRRHGRLAQSAGPLARSSAPRRSKKNREQSRRTKSRLHDSAMCNAQTIAENGYAWDKPHTSSRLADGGWRGPFTTANANSRIGVCAQRP
ncbi:hypothetical protein QBC47DRAFT_460992 [Echria macrotheca]|uniref:Uncharacterized protein n=1 Tax=Echria macrotheca TaxID=438768 RepID=A0AAJ0F5U0_9PEZI|nr:hypothetical protein QBC47DRAFT_460992 [Echria macrotheca]